MQNKVLIILAALTCFYQMAAYADSQMFRVLKNEEDYKEYRVEGYNLEPEVPGGYWLRECGNANHACVTFERRDEYAREAFKEAPLLRDRR